jgi:superfamily II DNA or RNA helicase
MVRFNLCDLIVVPPGYGKTIVILHTANLIVENYDMRVVIVCTNEM